jgi:glycosyltransferase involved in cell wall biosynthesis
MRISVVVCVYNGKQYLEEQFDSIKNQSRSPDEVLIFDDDSTDGSSNWIRKYINDNKLTEWKLKINQENCGWRKNFKKGLLEASGDIVFPCDQDDIWNYKKIENCEKLMENSHIKVLSTGYFKFSKKNEILRQKKVKLTKAIKQTIHSNFLLVNRPGCTYCIRREFLHSIEKYWDDSYPHDALIWRLSLFGDGLYICNSKLTNWRMHRDSAFSSEKKNMLNRNSRIEWISYAWENIELLKRYCQENNVLNIREKQKKIIKSEKWLDLRKKFLESRKKFHVVPLVKYIGFYPHKLKGFLGDILCVIKIKA